MENRRISLTEMIEKSMRLPLAVLKWPLYTSTKNKNSMLFQAVGGIQWDCYFPRDSRSFCALACIVSRYWNRSSHVCVAAQDHPVPK